MNQNSRLAEAGATWPHKVLGSWNHSRAWAPLAGVWVRGAGGDTTLPSTQPRAPPPAARRAQLPGGLPSSTLSGFFHGVSARPRSGRGLGGCASGIAHRPPGRSAVPSCSGADGPEDRVTESAVPGARAGATGLQQGRRQVGKEGQRNDGIS